MYRTLVTLTVAFMASVAHTATLEIPSPNSTQSGIQLISGWKCEVNGPLTIRFDGGEAIPLVYGSERGDTRKPKGPCDEANTGFIAIMNWGNLTDGIHTAVVYDNGVEFDRSTFSVVTTGVDFLRGVTGSGEATLSNGQQVRLEWSEASQSFVATDFTAPSGSGSGLCTTKTATVYDYHVHSVADPATWVVTNPCDGETLDIDMMPLTSGGFFACSPRLEFVQGGVQFDSSHFDWFDMNALDSVCGDILYGITKQTTVDVGGETTSLNFSKPFKMYYDGQLIFEFP